MSQLSTKLTPLDLRTQLHQMVVNDLLGPAGGPGKEIDEDSVCSRYIVGLLPPKSHNGRSCMSYICTACWECLLGFDLDEHTLSVHQGIEPGYRKVWRK